MEIIIAIVVFGFGLWWVFVRKPADTTPPTLYKVETPPTPEPVPAYDVVPPQPEPVSVVIEGAGTVEVTPASAVTAPAKKPRKPRAPKVVAPVEKPAAKKAAPVKKAAAIKAAPKKPATPKSKKG